MKNKILLLLIGIPLMAGCSVYHISSEEISSEYYPSKKSTEGITYLENINQPHEVIGYVTVNAERRQRLADVMERMKYEAAMMGADAFTDIKTDATGAWKKLPAQDFVKNGYVRANFTATAVVFK